jgi:hypothetical protein
MTCPHPLFRAEVDVNRLLDSGCFLADVRIFCSECGESFRFLGCPAGLNFRQPTVSIDELELHAPIEPQGEPRLQSTATFEMPDIPKRH